MFSGARITPRRRQSETSFLSTNVAQKSLETEFSIVIFLSIFDPRLSIVKNVFDCPLPGVRISDSRIINSAALFRYSNRCCLYPSHQLYEAPTGLSSLIVCYFVFESKRGDDMTVWMGGGSGIHYSLKI